MRFSKLQQVDVRIHTSVWRIYFPDDTAMAIKVAYAGKDNKPFWEEFLRSSTAFDRATNSARQKKNRKKLEADVLKQLASDFEKGQLDLYARHILKDWWMEELDENRDIQKSPVVDEDTGKPCECTPENAKAFLEELPPYLWDELRDHCSTPENFLQNIDAEATAKNS